VKWHGRESVGTSSTEGAIKGVSEKRTFIFISMGELSFKMWGYKCKIHHVSKKETSVTRYTYILAEVLNFKD
jgi:hypothetical protein